MKNTHKINLKTLQCRISRVDLTANFLKAATQVRKANVEQSTLIVLFRIAKDRQMIISDNVRCTLPCYFWEDVTIHFMVEREVRGKVDYAFKDYVLWHHDVSIKNIEIIVIEKNKFVFYSCQSR